MVERVVDSRLIAYSDSNNLTPDLQSAYRRNHSTETTLVRLYNDMIRVIDSWRASSSRHVGSFRYSGPSNHVWCSEPSLRYSRCCADLISFVFRWKIPGGQSWFRWVEGDEVVNWCSSRISSRPKIFHLLRRGCARNLQMWGTIVPFIRRRHAGTSKFAATGCSQYSREFTGLYHCGFWMVCIETYSTERQEDGSPMVWIKIKLEHLRVKLHIDHITGVGQLSRLRLAKWVEAVYSFIFSHLFISCFLIS